MDCSPAPARAHHPDSRGAAPQKAILALPVRSLAGSVSRVVFHTTKCWPRAGAPPKPLPAARQTLVRLAKCSRSAADKSSLSSWTLAAAVRTAADCSSKSSSLLQRSSFFFSRFHIPASLLPYRSSSIFTLPGLSDHAPPRPEESNLHRVAI